jgi:alkaline phosphatase D
MRRRSFLASTLGPLGAVTLRGAPALVTADAARPRISAIQAGDVDDSHAVIWGHVDRPARLVVEWDTTDTFRSPRRVTGPAALEDSGFTARVVLADLPRGQRVFYRVSFQDLGDLRTWSTPELGSFHTPATERGLVRLAWSADTVGQGWGINPEWGGLRMFETIRKAEPHLFVNVGDHVYADNPLVREVKLDDGRLWRNLVTPAKEKVAETLDEFRGQYLYNRLDENLRRFAAEVPQVSLWDDHEVVNNWYPTEVLEDPRYTVKSVALLAARAKRAFLEQTPMRWTSDDAERVYRRIGYGPSLDLFALDMRSHRGPNTPGRQTVSGPECDLLGPAQLQWLKNGLRASTATWKVVAADLPLGLVVTDGERDFEAVANGNGPASGRELEIADLLRFLKRERIRNVVWITGDVHYAAAHHYAPERAQLEDFDPFWEFVAGPLHAGTIGAKPLDDTFGPEVRFQGIPGDMKPNRPPSEGLQFFGTLTIAREGVLTAALHNLAGEVLFTIDLEPRV